MIDDKDTQKNKGIENTPPRRSILEGYIGNIPYFKEIGYIFNTAY